MAQTPAWSEEEFRMLLANETLAAEQLAKRIDRSPDAITIVRAGVKRWRDKKENKNILSKMMIRVLNEKR